MDIEYYYNEVCNIAHRQFNMNWRFVIYVIWANIWILAFQKKIEYFYFQKSILDVTCDAFYPRLIKYSITKDRLFLFSCTTYKLYKVA